MVSPRAVTKRTVLYTFIGLFLLVSASFSARYLGAETEAKAKTKVTKARGHIGPDLSDDKWRYGSSNQEIFDSIAEGRAGGMPPFSKNLKEEEIWGIVSYIRSMTQDIEGLKKKIMISEGEKAYRENCGVCHGADAKGAIGPNLLETEQWKYGKTDAKAFESISKGRPGGMHGWQKYIGDEKIWDIIAYLKSLSREGTENHKMEILAAKGKPVYMENCAACHGPDALGRNGPSLIDKEWKYGSTDQTIFDSIAKGRHGEDMPSFGKTLGEENIWNVIAYIRSIAEEEEQARVRQIIAEGEKLYKQRCAVCHGKDVRAFAVSPPPFSEGIFPCSDCHEDLEPNAQRRVLEDEHTDIELTHAAGQRWCLDCHDTENRDVLRLANGEKVPFTESYRLCGQCHGDKYRDWRAGTHGKRTGMWDGQKQYLLCAHCHNPHSPRFNPLIPLPPPARPEDIK
jgi:mono/diheme cytochrome c family protein